MAMAMMNTGSNWMKSITRITSALVNRSRL